MSAQSADPLRSDTVVVSSGTVAIALSALSGVLYFLGFAGFEIVPLAFISIAPLLLAIRGRSGWVAFRLGWLMGTVLVSGGFYWIAGMLKSFSGFPLPICIGLALLLWAAQGLQYGAFAWLVTRADARNIPRLASVPAALATVELCFPALFPYYTANSLHNWTLWIQTADIGGVVMVSMALALGHAALDEVIARAITHRGSLAHKLRPLVFPLAFWALALPYGAWRMRQTDAAHGRTLRVGIVQENLGLQEKRTDPRLALERHLASSRALEARGVDLLVWSESALAFFIPDTAQNIQTLIPPWNLHTPVLFGALSVRGTRDAPRYYNTAFMTDAQGNIRGRYDKIYLLAFGEYLPGGETFPIFYQWSPNSGHFSPGTTMEPMTIPGGTLLPLICYEDILPRFVRNFQHRVDANVMAVILNDAWFGDSVEPWIHNALSQFRAVEERRDLIRAANSGVSSVIDANGRMIAQGGTFRRATVLSTVRLRDGHTVYGYLGDWAAYLGLALCAYTFVATKAPVVTNTDLDVLYDSERTSIARRIVVSVVAGLAFWAMCVFFHWGLHPGEDLRAIWAPRLIGGGVALAMLIGVFISRVVRCVAIDTAAHTLRLDRDPGVLETIALTDIQSVSTELARGGWSTNPSEKLVLTLHNGTVTTYVLPDDADTPAIARDITAARDGTAPPTT